MKIIFKILSLYILLALNSKSEAYAQFLDTLILQFEIGKEYITPAHKQQLQVLQKYPTADISLLIYGYADYLGQPAANKLLSSKRAKNVQTAIDALFSKQPTYLVCMGLGQVDIKGATLQDGNPLYRTVHVIVRAKGVAPKSQPGIIPNRSQKPDTLIAKLNNPKIKEATISIQKYMDATSVKQTFVLENLHFLRHLAVFTEPSYDVLYALLATMRDNPELHIRIEGHICCNHVEGANPASAAYKLSQMRAAAVYRFLLENGIDKSRLSYLGYGTLKPIVENDQKEEDAIKNRRVEVRIISK